MTKKTILKISPIHLLLFGKKSRLITGEICKKIDEFYQTKSEIAKKILTDFSGEIKKFLQVCPKVNKLENPISIISKKKSA